MASIAESSVGSLPLAQLAQLQEQFLQGRVRPEANDGDEATFTTTSHTGDRSGRSKGIGDDVIAESADAYRTPVSSPKKVPRLESARSAPPAEMEAMVNPSPSQEAFHEMTRANSFHGFAGGDTQPLESQTYNEFWESMAKSKATTTPKREKVVLQISPDGKVEYTYDTHATERTPRTCEEGDTGYIDLQKELQFDGRRSPTVDSVDGFDDLIDVGSPEQELPVQRAVFRKPAMPETPSLAGHKRRRSGEMLTSETSAKKTPGFSQVFGFKARKGDMMTGTQLFEQTQARSSPMPDALRSDPAITRPSPNMQQNIPISSPTVMMSSPIYNRAPPATAGEPREKYTSLLESQERKRARLEEHLGFKRHSDHNFDDFEEDEHDTQRRRFSAQRLHRAYSDQALHELRRVGAQSKPRSRPATSSSPRKPAMIDLRTPATTKRGGEFDFEFSDDGEGPNDEEIVEDRAGVEEDENVDHAANNDRQSENDEYDELGQTVLRSQGPGDDEEDGEVEQINGLPDEMAELANEDDTRRTLVQDSSQQPHNHTQRRSQPATQHSAIADSQPFRNERQQPLVVDQATNGSPNCSWVPGSQYVGKTSQDQASLPAKRTQVSMGPPTLSASKSQDAAEQVVPSSPPLAAKSASDYYTAETSIEHRDTLGRSEDDQSTTEQRVEQEIPESDLPAPDQGSSRPATAEDRRNTESNNAPFSSARSHLSTNAPSLSQGAPLPPSPLKVFASQQSKVSSQSPRTKAGVRHFADIAGTGAAPTGSGETLADVDAVMSDLITAEDQQFLDATSSPPRERLQKRRRVVGMPSIRSSSPVKEVQGAVPEPRQMETEHIEMQKVDEMNHSGPQGDADEVEARALKNSPSKANEQRVEPPPPESTPESVKQREQAGARAASQLLSKRLSKVVKPAKLSGNGRKAGSKLQHQISVTHDQATSKARAKPKRASRVKGISPVENDAPEAAAPADGANEPEIGETVVETHEDDTDGEPEPQTEDDVVVASQRVFALFKGTFNAFYPATWLGVSNGGRHRVKFDDGTVTSIEPHLACRLQLALGDQVKVDWQGMKSKNWIVKGFGPALTADKAKETLTDMHGHETVKVQAKSTRNSVSGPSAVAQGEGEIVNVALEVVYLTHSMWSNFSSREFQPGVIGQRAAARLETPSTGVQSPVEAETPLSRSRRATTSTSKVIEKRGSILREESAAAVKTPSAGLFHGMTFAVSYGQHEGEKVNVTRLIQRNGGTILDDGFEGLFDAPDVDDIEDHSPTKESKKTTVVSDKQSGLQLKADHKDLGFVALIADKHSRRAKYIQALALGIPTLSGRWIMDSLDASKNTSLSGANAATLQWTKYLLAAGESSYLNGAIRSRVIPITDAASAKLENSINNRPRLLNGEGVLIVASKKSKATWERRKAFAFLTLALGAGHVKRVSDLQEAKALLADNADKWRFVYVDGSVADASATLFAKGGTGGDKKRKREDGPVVKVKGDAKAMSAFDGSVRVVNDEFVVQSLILGGLVD